MATLNWIAILFENRYEIYSVNKLKVRLAENTRIHKQSFTEPH